MESEKRDSGQHELLSGWKEIAGHLGKGVRTVQRYERDLNLPVRRVSGKTRGSVVATKSDLDSWVRLSPTAQESINRLLKFNAEQESFNQQTWSAEDHLVSEIKKGLQDRAALQAQMTELRQELRQGLRNLGENLMKLRQQLNETRRRQDLMASAIKEYSRVGGLLSVNKKRKKPN